MRWGPIQVRCGPSRHPLPAHLSASCHGDRSRQVLGSAEPLGDPAQPFTLLIRSISVGRKREKEAHATGSRWQLSPAGCTETRSTEGNKTER